MAKATTKFTSIPGGKTGPTTPNAQGAGAPAPDGPCPVTGCKTKPQKFGFCPTHFDHFKFGLITKNGVPVSDFDKKFDAYLRLQKKQNAA